MANGSAATGVLPVGLKMRRRAAALRARPEAGDDRSDPLRALNVVEC